MGRKKNLYDCGSISDFYCTECGNKGVPIFRKGNQKKEAGHLKKIYCIHCKKETNHVEVRPYGSYTQENFKKEFELGRFINGNRISESELMFCSNTTCLYNINKKCWNSNYSYKCRYRLDRSNYLYG